MLFTIPPSRLSASLPPFAQGGLAPSTKQAHRLPMHHIAPKSKTGASLRRCANTKSSEHPIQSVSSDDMRVGFDTLQKEMFDSLVLIPTENISF